MFLVRPPELESGDGMEPESELMKRSGRLDQAAVRGKDHEGEKACSSSKGGLLQKVSDWTTNLIEAKVSICTSFRSNWVVRADTY